MSATRRGVGVGVGVVMAALLLAAALGLLRGRERNVERAALPQLAGTLAVPGLVATVEIVRDGQGVPHVFAASEEDAWFGLGFVHAQDRLAQMLWLRRLARGRTAEILGPAGLPADRLARVLDLGGLADAEWERADPKRRTWLEAYSRGVNARIARVQSGEVGAPVAVARAGLPVEPWQPADSLALLKLHAWSLGGSLDASLVLHDLLGRLGGVDARPFFPGAGGGPLPEPDRLPHTARWSDPLRRAVGLAGASAGSSAWVLGGHYALDGHPLLVADLHVTPTAPALFHLAHLRGGELDLAGVMIPGLPLVWTGRNGAVAWASTDARVSVTDLYVEMVEDDARYHDGRSWLPLGEREEHIAVRGGRDELLTVRSTRHGPLLDGVVADGQEPLALAWVGQRGRGFATLAAWRQVARAADAAALRAALAKVSEPAVAVVYGDAAGDAGLQVAGWVPRRPLETGLVPVPGRARWYDWEGRVPYGRLPERRLSSGRGWAIAADNPLAEPGPGGVEWLWRDGQRGRRIDAGLRALVRDGPVGLGPVTELQNDIDEPRGPKLVRAALELAGPRSALDSHAREVAELLRGWDGVAAADSPGAAAYHAFLMALTRELFAPPLGDALLGRYLAVARADPTEVAGRLMLEAADGGEGDTWTDPERVGGTVRESLRQAWFQLSSRLGANRRKWQWGRLHQVRFAPFVPESVTGAGLSVGPFELGGSGTTVAAAEYAPSDPFDVRLAAVVRFATDVGDPAGFRAVVAPGQSEHPADPEFDGGLEAWLEGRLERIPLAEAAIRQQAVARLVLEPAP